MKRKYIQSLILWLLGLVFSFQVWAFNEALESGCPFITNYNRDDYQGHNQNWCVIQDHRGIIYLGNTSGLIEYDGKTWRNLDITKSSTIARSLAIDSLGTIYVGSYNQFGYLVFDNTGHYGYISISDSLKTQKNFGNVWEVFATSHGIFFFY